ncbi:patatin-like phospholipase family protein [Haloferula rosea]|uniref:Patatin-like phospholipase family protein n=1 Tax=Haloferula rosea TaxID=490093 RepID=A0A934RCL3_9BACT|nr:patatin-like phospholipase family protein [Haloferula rosea]MBK1828085.1 patatin-like phospholipase family protein [Haloferula rosea]
MNEPSTHPPDPARTAVILSSSFLGVYAHAGFLNALDARGFDPARIAGCSAGALAGAFHTCGLRGDALKDAALDPRLRRSFFDLGFLWRLPGVATSFWSTGIFSGKRTVHHLRKLLGERDISELPLDIAVTNLTKGISEIKRSGPLAETIMASCAVPALFTIQQIGDDRFLDGGIAAEFPYEQFIDDPDIDTILIHRIRHEEGSQPNVNWETVSNVISMSHHTACNELHRMRGDLAAQKGKRVIEATSTTPFPGLLSNRLAPTCYDLGYETATKLDF